MGSDAASIFDFVRAARTWVARHVGISGLGTNPTTPWCQHPSRSPLPYVAEAGTGTWNSQIGPGPHCFICGLPVIHDSGGGQDS